MSPKIQISCSETNKLWVQILKNKWKSVSRITKDIKRLENNKLNEQNILLKLQEQDSNYIFQKQKILKLEIMIKYFQKSCNHELDMISTLSTILTRVTC